MLQSMVHYSLINEQEVLVDIEVNDDQTKRGTCMSHDSYHIAVLLIFILVSHISQAGYTIRFCNEHPKLICTPYCKLIIYI